MDEQGLKNLISEITGQVIKRLNSSPSVEEQGALVIVPAYVPDEAALKAYLKQTYGEKLTYWLLEGTEPIDADANTQIVRAEAGANRLLGALKYAADVILAVPPLRMIICIAHGDDAGVAEQAILKAVLWGKSVTVLLDFEKPRFRRGTFFETLSDALKAIEDMGVSVVSLPLSVRKKTDEKALVTEADIEDVVRNGDMRVRKAAGAIVTPLARDTAKELGVEID
jgi:hypothetical protein